MSIWKRWSEGHKCPCSQSVFAVDNPKIWAVIGFACQWRVDEWRQTRWTICIGSDLNRAVYMFFKCGCLVLPVRRSSHLCIHTLGRIPVECQKMFESLEIDLVGRLWWISVCGVASLWVARGRWIIWSCAPRVNLGSSLELVDPELDCQMGTDPAECKKKLMFPANKLDFWGVGRPNPHCPDFSKAVSYVQATKASDWLDIAYSKKVLWFRWPHGPIVCPP